MMRPERNSKLSVCQLPDLTAAPRGRACLPEICCVAWPWLWSGTALSGRIIRSVVLAVAVAAALRAFVLSSLYRASDAGNVMALTGQMIVVGIPAAAAVAFAMIPTAAVIAVAATGVARAEHADNLLHAQIKRKGNDSNDCCDYQVIN